MAIPITDLMNATAEGATLREQERIIKLLTEKWHDYFLEQWDDDLNRLIALIKGEK